MHHQKIDQNKWSLCLMKWISVICNVVRLCHHWKTLNTAVETQGEQCNISYFHLEAAFMIHEVSLRPSQWPSFLYSSRTRVLYCPMESPMVFVVIYWLIPLSLCCVSISDGRIINNIWITSLGIVKPIKTRTFRWGPSKSLVESWNGLWDHQAKLRTNSLLFLWLWNNNSSWKFCLRS